jgi:hypothetical protein
MKNAVPTTVDSAGRLILPKAAIILQKGPLRIAAPAEEGPALSEAIVEVVLREVRERVKQEGPPESMNFSSVLRLKG